MRYRLGNSVDFFLIDAFAGENVDTAVGATVVLPNHGRTDSKTSRGVANYMVALVFIKAKRHIHI